MGLLYIRGYINITYLYVSAPRIKGAYALAPRLATGHNQTQA
jgi:hypothetical protein